MQTTGVVPAFWASWMYPLTDEALTRVLPNSDSEPPLNGTVSVETQLPTTDPSVTDRPSPADAQAAHLRR